MRNVLREILNQILLHSALKSFALKAYTLPLLEG
ncbi:hypothetical protein NEOC95_000803 [Neochlamydia sp. AcF95]|nr:hypothetical protein [Neochlamydia sp. AcF95]